MSDSAWITPAELADLFGGVSLQAVYKILNSLVIVKHVASNRRRMIAPSDVRHVLETRGFLFQKRNVSLQIVKGGTGKTSLAFALATRASHYGARVLAIDFDQQGNLTRSFSADARDRRVWLHIVRDRIDVTEAIVPVSDGLDLLPSNLNNSRLDVELTGFASNLKDMVRDKLAGVRDRYDLIVMDCPPALNKINTAATCGSDTVLVPINPDPYAMDGLDFTLSELSRIKEEFKASFDYNIIWNRYDARERLGVFYMHELAKNPERAAHVLPVVIRTDTSVKNAVFASTSVFDLSRKRSAFREDIDQFTREVLGINQWKEARNSKSAA